MDLKTLNNMRFPFKLETLPYQKDSLKPFMSEETFDYHHGAHHAAYVKNLNALLEKNETLKNKTLKEIILASAGDEKLAGIFNNAAQVWNHYFFWLSMSPNKKVKPEGELLKQIESCFGSYDAFKEEFKKIGLGQFGSGWVWLLYDAKEKKLAIHKTANAMLPMVDHHKALLACDVWEHAYYIDYRNNRAKYLDAFLDNLINWDFASENFAS